MSEKPQNPLEGILSDFALGPAWARAKTDAPKEKFKDGGEREYKPRRRDNDRGGRDNRDNRNQRGGERRDDRRQGGGGNRRDLNKGGRGRPDFQREEIAPAEGVTVTLKPDKHAIQLVCKEVHQVARVYPLFDIAQIILAERARSRATFEISDKKEPFYKCKLEEAIYLTKEEALRHFLQADWRSRFVEESTVEVEPPKGNFQSVAKCGISGEWLGPPNYHAYQTEIRRIHRERFAHMPFESYQAKVRTERSEEAVNEWLESMKIQTRWRILSDAERAAAKAAEAEAATTPPPSSETPPAENAAAPATEEPATPQPVVEDSTPEDSAPETEAIQEEETNEASATVEASEAVEETPESSAPPEEQAETPPEEPAAETPPPTDDIKWFTDRPEIERAIATEVLEKAFQPTRKATVSAAISGKNLSPGLLVRLKGTGNHHRKHPAIMIPVICKILEAEHMPVFKRKGKLFTGPARPHALAADAVLAPRPGEMVTWIRENTPAKLEGLWKAVLPEGATAPPAEYAADLFWLLQQGHILLYTDDTLVVQEQPKPQAAKKPKQPKKKATPAASDKPADKPEEAPEAPSPQPNGEEEIPAPTEIIADAVTKTTEIVSEAASKIIDSVASAAAPEAPAPTPEESKESTPEPAEKPEKDPLP